MTIKEPTIHMYSEGTSKSAWLELAENLRIQNLGCAFYESYSKLELNYTTNRFEGFFFCFCFCFPYRIDLKVNLYIL